MTTDKTTIENVAEENNEKKIKSVSEFLDAVSKYKNKCEDEDSSIFYRGESKDYGDTAFLPSVLRLQKNSTKKLIYKYTDDTEFHLYNSVLLSNPNAFKNDTTVFEKIVRMQHYGLPTRLLDITSNPLVALYFACKDIKNEEGFVYILGKKYMNKIPYNEETVEFISNMILLDRKLRDNALNLDECNFLYILSFYKFKSFKYMEDLHSLFNIDEKFHDLFNEKYSKYIKVYPRESKSVSLFIEYCFKESYFNFEYNDSLKVFYSKLSDNYVFQKLNKNLSDDFILEKLSGLRGLTYIIPPNSNERLKAQSGSFIFFGNIPNKSTPKKTEISQTIVIDKDYKESILKELDVLNINRLTLFPDLANACEYYKEKYGF